MQTVLVVPLVIVLTDFSTMYVYAAYRIVRYVLLEHVLLVILDINSIPQRLNATSFVFLTAIYALIPQLAHNALSDTLIPQALDSALSIVPLSTLIAMCAPPLQFAAAASQATPSA